MTAFNPDYPTPGALAYRDGFLKGAAVGGLRSIPDDVLSRAIDRAIERKAAPLTAGRVFADVYFDLAVRRRPRGGYTDPINYLLSAYGLRLEDKK